VVMSAKPHKTQILVQQHYNVSIIIVLKITIPLHEYGMAVSQFRIFFILKTGEKVYIYSLNHYIFFTFLF